MGGRGTASGFPTQTATQATQIENMNEAQLRKEIAKTKGKLTRLQAQRTKLSKPSATAAAMQQAFPLSAGTASTSSQLQKFTGKLAAQTLKQATALTKVIDDQNDATKRLNNLQSALTQVKGTGQTLKQIQQAQTAQAAASNPVTRKWTTVQKQAYSNGSLKPRILKSGEYEIRGTSVLTIWKNGQQIGGAASLSQAKAIVERLDSKKP